MTSLSRTERSPEVITTARLSRLDNIVGVKEAFGDPARIEALVERCSDGFAVLTGDDATACASMLAGGHGDISVTANVVPKQMADMCRAAIAGDRATAEAIDARIAPLHVALFHESNPIPVKWALAEMGRIGGTLRLPLTPLDKRYHDALREALRAAGALHARAAAAVAS